MARRKRPGISDYLDGLEKPAVATSKRKGAAQTAPRPTATAGKRRKITLYFREALLEEARSAVLELGAAGRDPANLSRDLRRREAQWSCSRRHRRAASPQIGSA